MVRAGLLALLLCLARPAWATISISGTVYGLSGSGLVIQNEGGSNITLSSPTTTFSFASQPTGAYSVTVLTQPTSPSLTCSVANGSGSSASNVTGINIFCPNAYFSFSMPSPVFEGGAVQALGFVFPFSLIWMHARRIDTGAYVSWFVTSGVPDSTGTQCALQATCGQPASNLTAISAVQSGLQNK
jgi:hypothetical protein